MSRPLNIAIDARLFSGKSGGIEQVAIGLIDALSRLGDGDEVYTVLTYPLSHDWIAPYIAGPCRMLLTTAVRPPPADLAQGTAALSDSDGTIEREGVNLVHFILQRAFFTAVPSIYHPHDLQHVHLPQFFSPRELTRRETMLRAFCNQARAVSVTSSWVKQDVMRHFDLRDDKVAVVPLTGALSAYPTPSDSDLAAIRAKLSLPDAFAFYPAQTWPHKNHLVLLDAIALLRDRHQLTVPLVCSGHQTDHFAAIQKRIAELNLHDRVHFAGFISPLELAALYRLCRCVVIPTLFEAASGPLNEAFMAGAPAACSNVTSLPAQAGDSALVFDPRRPDDIAAAVMHLWNDADLRATLAQRGKLNVSRFTWQRAARHFRAWYRKLCGRAINDQDRHFLDAPPLI